MNLLFNGRVTAARLFLIALPLVFLTGAVRNDDPRGVVTAFYELYLKVHPLGVPSEKDLAKLKPYLSKPLQLALRNALAAEQRYAKKNRGAVPPLVESDIFTSLFEGASGFKVIACEAQAKAATCNVRFSRTNADGKVPTQWQDRLHMVRESPGWAIDDVEYLGDWQFMHKGRLKALLQQVIKEGGKK